MTHDKQSPDRTQPPPKIDPLRRRFAKGGLAAPVVVGSLLSRPVLGETFHNCTMSGQMSGNVSTHEQGICATLGTGGTVPDRLNSWPSWPDQTDFYNSSRKGFAYARAFPNTPFSSQIRFENAYKVMEKGSFVRNATVLEVLLGEVPNYNNDGTFYGRSSDFELIALRPNRASLDFGKETIVTYLNAASNYPNFPLTKGEVVAIFNSIATTGQYVPVGGATPWNSVRVLEYFQSLHT